jgi:hypothetical protein
MSSWTSLRRAATSLLAVIVLMSSGSPRVVIATRSMGRALMNRE